jgi:holo-[acyl-carrier protein] synthase
MMRALGIDAVDIERFRRALERSPRLSHRVFTADERADVARRSDPVPSLAARFAVREAVMKALGVGLGGFDLQDVSVVSHESGQPHVRITGRAAELASRRDISSWHLSITHTEQVAIAVVAAA